jgi:amidase
MDELANLDATAQADLVRRKQVKPIELVDAAIERIERLNPQINAVVTPMYTLGRKAAEGPIPDGPFSGVPFLLKDLQAAYAGVPLTSGSVFHRDHVPSYDSEIVARHKRAGLIVIGKTNTPEFGLIPTTEPALFGPALNPWDTGRSTGGSSGGSAAAVAAGMVPMAHGGDGGGSIRIPASCCGVFGMKPTRGRTPLGPDVGDLLNGLTAQHGLTLSVRDSAALLDVTAGPDVGDPYVAPPPARPFLDEVGADPGRLRIAFTTTAATDTAVHEDCVAAVKDAAALCEDLGHEVVEASPPLNGPLMVQMFTTMWAAGAALSVDGLAMLAGRAPKREEFEPLTWALAELGRSTTAFSYLAAVATLQVMSRHIARFFEEHDVWLTPTVTRPPLPLGSFDSPPENPMAGFAVAAEFVPFTPVCNFTGQPAMSVPLHWNSEGLPIGTHFVGRFGDEATLFRLAAQLEQARPWADRRPPVSAQPAYR